MNSETRSLSPEHMALAQTALDVFDTKFFKALCEPTRVEIIRKLVLIGTCDVGTIADGLAQDRSVISRHLAVLERAGICQTRKIGRRVFYDLDGPHNVAKVATILEAIKPMAYLCKPFEDLSEQNKKQEKGSRKGVA
ncbi:MAG: metalloregulator ArsR/SmtB family transcription factor [Robiginitomaculum sp.]|nr:metalloregulator ArsR/SmtB family transcription factor [Robiginitomaculum sp.]